ncbi:molybdopterin dehydrogenase, FAD-binding protein [Desulforamulus reducens MI-1]|uniref:Molybdopterin dehydrogenase, FAD-binding protein n=1 Tax=Desulforamulus reducens (strain ATCC BAA-1160 / DSM 100696 / MI-1) TaxID=349161 RepID=A4J873_DESRM|nr:xanthine dehydrogenase family protein subunit M [Desulforamulus reducens]ABO51276.1 molybdopterin dehydrogenase, FAD-binding protein [Desulforamulus reducens MI-1]
MEVITPVHLEEALGELYRDSSQSILAGGTDFLVKRKNGQINPSRAINIYNLQELKFIRKEQGQLIIGPLMTHQELVESSMVGQYAPLLAAACSQVGSLQIRNRGTLGGNLVTASPAGDTMPALVVSNATLLLRSAHSEREVSIVDFINGPGKTVLQPGELLTAIKIPCWEPEQIGFYRKLGQRKAMAISIVSVAFKARLVNQVLEDVRIACGSVGPTVMELKRTAQNLTRYSLWGEELWTLVSDAGAETSPISDVRASQEYRRKMVGALLYEGLQDLSINKRC